MIAFKLKKSTTVSCELLLSAYILFTFLAVCFVTDHITPSCYSCPLLTSTSLSFAPCTVKLVTNKFLQLKTIISLSMRFTF
jgi:hypothetical protein